MIDSLFFSAKTAIASLLPIVPAHNLDFRRFTSPVMARLGRTATEVWQRLFCAPQHSSTASTHPISPLCSSGGSTFLHVALGLPG
jgi:hypothetical protein